MKDYQDVLETFKFFTKKVFPGCPRDVSFNVFEGFGQYSFFYSKQILCVIITVTKCLQTMSFPELQASYYSEPYEWITARKIKEYVSNSKDCCKYGHKHIFPDLHINKENRMYGVKLYTFNFVNDIKLKLSEKLLHHFYSLCDIIFGAIS